MKGKIILITGANRGIGKETTRALAKKGATIIMACRNQEKAERLKEKDITVNSLHPGHVDTNMWDLWGPEKKWYQSIINGMIKLFLISAEEGAQTSIYLASSNEVIIISYFN